MQLQFMQDPCLELEFMNATDAEGELHLSV